MPAGRFDPRETQQSNAYPLKHSPLQDLSVTCELDFSVTRKLDLSVMKNSISLTLIDMEVRLWAQFYKMRVTCDLNLSISDLWLSCNNRILSQIRLGRYFSYLSCHLVCNSSRTRLSGKILKKKSKWC